MIKIVDPLYIRKFINRIFAMSIPPNKISRREALKRCGTAAVLAAASGTAYFYAYNRSSRFSTQGKSAFMPDFRIKNYSRNLPRVAVCSGTDIPKMVDMLLEKLGHMQNFVSKGDCVVIKPNAAFNRIPAMGATTHPAVVRRLVYHAVLAGAREVWVTDVPCNNPEQCFNHSGIKEAVLAVHGKLFIPSDRDYVSMDIQNLGDLPVVKLYLRADKVINVAPVKHHSLSMLTAGMKNWY